jgi:hypothetical protein
MTFLTIILFSVALAASIGVIVANIGNALPGIAEVIEAEFAPVVRSERRINFGAVKQHQVLHTAEVVAFPAMARTEQEFKLAA